MFELPPSPRLSGAPMRALVRAAGAAAFRRALVPLLRKDLGIEAALDLPAGVRGAFPLDARPMRAREDHQRPSAELEAPALPELHSAARLVEAYRSGSLTPTEVAERILEAADRLGAQRPAMDPFSFLDREGVLRDAAASTERYQAGQPLGALDGVPIPIKEECDVIGSVARQGTAYKPIAPAARDAEPVARMRARGALILGHTAMTELGMSPLGVNPNRSLPRNVYSPDHLAGGSSTGSAVAVAAGLCPVALGTDGGGSVRIPSSWAGLFGLKPTFGRLSRDGNPFGGTVDHLGPLGVTVRDLAIFVEAAGGEDPADPLTHGTPAPVGLVRALGRGVEGLVIGVLEEEIEDADEEIARGCRAALKALEKEGAILRPVTLPMAKHAPAIGFLTIGSETYAATLEARRHSWEQMGADFQFFCRIMSELQEDYIDAQHLRSALREQTATLLREVDLLASPTTAICAPPITDAEAASAIIDAAATAGTCRFAFLGNLTGLPAGTAPVGFSSDGLPYGLQLMGDAFDEACVLQALAHLERAGIATVKRPPTYRDILR